MLDALTTFTSPQVADRATRTAAGPRIIVSSSGMMSGGRVVRPNAEVLDVRHTYLY
jgi:predicted metal-dependent RNase